MRTLFFSLIFALATSNAFALDIFNLNVFDQLQGNWESDFRAKRMSALAHYLNAKQPDIILFQEAKGAGPDSADISELKAIYSFRKYVHEMTGADGHSYGYWIGAKRAPSKWIEDGFHFPGGVERKVQAAIWNNGLNKSCLGVLSLHLSYQSSEVRQKEARWILNWLKSKEADCPHWLVAGDFNADEENEEMKILFEGGLKSLFKNTKPTVGAFNPIRRIYGENIPSRTIDWALGWNVSGEADVVLDAPYLGQWVSDHAAVWVRLSD